LNHLQSKFFYKKLSYLFVISAFPLVLISVNITRPASAWLS
jgi:hypothetical protein